MVQDLFMVIGIFESKQELRVNCLFLTCNDDRLAKDRVQSIYFKRCKKIYRAKLFSLHLIARNQTWINAYPVAHNVLI